MFPVLSYISVSGRVSDMTVTTSCYEANASLKLRCQTSKPHREPGLGGNAYGTPFSARCNALALNSLIR